jgi:hypothetical protein
MYAGTICPQIENGKKGDERYFFKLSSKSGQLKMPPISFQPNSYNKTTSVANDCDLNNSCLEDGRQKRELEILMELYGIVETPSHKVPNVSK